MKPRMPSHDEGLAPAFRDFVAAMEAGDPRLVEKFFVPGDQTLLVRGGMVVGFAGVVESVRADPLAPIGRLVQTHMREIGPDGTLITATHRTARGGTGVMTLLWERTPQGWRIVSAHLVEPAPAIDTSVWREVGAPLEPPTGSGHLDGVSVAVADMFQLAGHRSGQGSGARLASALPADRTAPAVAALRAAGAEVVGLARIDELGLGDTGAHSDGMPPNPRAADRAPGGPMSGPTAAIALGQADLGLGVDTGGSLLLPAAYQGLYGLRTTYGLVSVEGVNPIAPSYDTLGWVARDPALLAEAAAVLLPEAGLRNVDEVLVGPDLLRLADPDVLRAIEAVIDRWDTSVLPLRVVGPERDHLDRWASTYRDVRNAEVADQHGTWAGDHPDQVGPDARAVIRAGQVMDPDRRREAQRAQAAARAAVAELVGNGVLLLPTTATVAPTRDRGGAAPRGRQWTQQLLSVASVGGLPAVTLPLATRKRLPCGLSLVGPVGSDHALATLARRLAEAGVLAQT